MTTDTIDMPIKNKIAEIINNGIVFIGSDYKVKLWNKWMVQHTDISAAQALHRDLTSIFPQIETSRLSSAIDLAIDKKMHSVLSPALNAFALPMYLSSLDRARNRQMKLLIHVFPFKDQQLGCGCLLQFTDMTAAVDREHLMYRKMADIKAAQTNLELAANVYKYMSEAIIVMDANRCILSVNPAFVRMTGYRSEEVVGTVGECLKSNQNSSDLLQNIDYGVLQNREWNGNIFLNFKDNAAHLCSVTITAIVSDEDKVENYLSVFKDITVEWLKIEQTRHQAFHDSLTDLPNRALLIERLERNIAITERDHRKLAVMFLDLDRFKQVNDTHGHHVGDALLKYVAIELKNLTRKTDTVSRLGGDEFVLLIDNPQTIKDVELLASRIITKMQTPVVIEGHDIKIGASVGIALYPIDGETPESLIKSADEAMYAAKLGGKNTYRFTRHYDDKTEEESM